MRSPEPEEKLMTAQKTHHHDETPRPGGPEPANPSAAAKKTFVEPVISQPVDVLEATTFFQTVDSGGTGIRKKGGD
jgi:hypothetical protein